MDALTATSTLQSLFLAEKDAAPSIQPHPAGSALIVRGTADQVTQIKLLLTQMDPNALLGERQKGTLRSIPLGGRDPDEFSNLLKQFWSTRHANPIIVVPSETNSIRDLRVPSATPRDEDKSRPNLGRISKPTVLAPQKPSVEAAREEPPKTPRKTTKSKSPSPRGEDLKAEPRARAVSPHVFAASFLEEERAEKQPAPLKKSKNNKPSKASKLPEASEGRQPPDLREPAGTTKPNDRSSSDRESPDSATDKTVRPAEDLPKKSVADNAAPILIVPSGGKLLLKSDDEAALDELEKLIELMQEATPTKSRWTVFYLRSADATETAAMLERLFPTSSVSSGVSSSGGMLGELTSGIGSMGRTLMNATGLNTLGTSALTLRIVPEQRSNALYVSGPLDQVREVEMMLKVLDASELPDQLRDRAPHSIEVQYADVEEVAAIVREVYKDDLTPEGQQQAGQQANPFAMFMGQGGNTSNRNNRGQQPRTIKLTLGVDTRTNTLIVSASETLFRQVDALVQSLDEAAHEAKRTVRVVDVGGANAAVVQQTLGAMYSKVKISSSGGKSRSSSASSSGSSSTPSTSTSSQMPFMPFTPFGGGNPDDMRR
ncbi:MAG TPA: secretin N-terminal domain-containing protein, partial [Planctomycetaceae bacterium]|nr:secretin N-terminal domain-containing protein [Planctomycetaceae bacterium]